MHIPTDQKTLQKIFFAIGTVGLGVSCAMTWKFGNSMSAIHGIALVTVTIMAAFIFPMRQFLKNAGHTHAARGIMVLGVFFIGLELFADLGYTIGMREKSMTEAGAQTVAYKHEQESVASERTNLTLWRTQLASLQAENAWAATVSADGLRAQLASAQKAIDLETARGGCKAKCLGLMQSKATLENKIATVEQVSGFTKRIEATQRILDKKTEVAVSTKQGFSPVKAQTDFVAQLYLALSGHDAKESLNPDEVSVSFTQIFIGLFIALGATFLPTTAYFLAFWTDSKTSLTATKSISGFSGLPGLDKAAAAIQRVHIKDSTLRDWARDLQSGNIRAA
jgi:hypothetical protein